MAANRPVSVRYQGVVMKSFYGHVLIGVLGLMYFCSSGVILPAANVVNPLMLQDASLGLNGTLLGMGFSLFVLFQGLSAPVIGALIARMGARFTMTIGAVVMLAASLCMVFVVTSPAAYFACFGVLASIGAMMAGQLSVQSTVGAWFVARRGVAMTATMFVGASSAFLLPPVIEAIIGATGGSWRGGWYLLIGLSVVMIPVAFFLVKDKPSDVGQLPDGSATVDDMAHQRKTFKVFKNEHSLPFAKAVRTPAFWLISLAATGGFAAYSFASSQGVIHFTTIGLDRALIVAGVSVMGGAGLVGKVVMGSLSDRIEPVRLVSASAFLIAAGTLVAAVASNPAMMYAYYFCTGFGFGAISATFPTAIANYFGASSFSKNLGAGIFITTLIASTLPLIGGTLFDATQSCTTAFFLAAGVVATCAACGLFVQFPSRQSESEEGASVGSLAV